MNLNDQSAANVTITTQRPASNRQEANASHSKPVFVKTVAIHYPTNKLINLLEKRVLDKLLPAIKRVYLRENEYLYRPEDRINYLYFPESAIISGGELLEDGKALETVMIGCEGVTKPLAIVNSQAATDWTQVIFAGSALRINIKELGKVFNENRDFQTIIFDYLQNCYEQSSQRIVCNTFHLLAERLSSWLLMIHDRTNNKELSLTHEKAARVLGVYRPNISVAAKSLQTRDIIKYERGHLTILNRRALEKAACSCYALNNVNFYKNGS